MDILTHALVGAAIGSRAESPAIGACVGAVVAVLPDLALCSIKRLPRPTEPYKWSHSVWPILVIWMFSPLMALCYASHLVLDIPTHASTWAPRPFYPWHHRIGVFREWEWFNRTWWTGAALAGILVLLALEI